MANSDGFIEQHEDVSIINNFNQEYETLEGLNGQNPDTGAGLADGVSYANQYTNRLFGAPFQLLKSVDYRFDNVNPYVGNEYLRNILLNSPILHIKPGMPKYTGGKNNNIWESIKNAYFTGSLKGSALEDMMMSLASNTLFSAGSGLQRRMYGFRETYYDYMQHVNYMCRSVATFMNLINNQSSTLPTGIHTGSGDTWEDFSQIEWANYRMIHSSDYSSPYELLKQTGQATLIGSLPSNLYTFFSGLSGLLDPNSSISQGLNGLSESLDQIADSIDYAQNTTIADVLSNKITTVQFMVEPVAFEESLTNETAQSMIESAIDGVGEIGAEIGWITNSSVDTGIIGSLTEFLGNVSATTADFISDVSAPITGGFVGNLFSGAIQSLKGQKMIYPDIYKNSKSTMDYQFSITLTSPYGDVYNYYTNIVVPLCHLIALAAPRMVTSNTVASPFLIQAYMPGMCTCNLGIISSMTITKNPDQNHVSVNGFPLTVKVQFTIKELYNAMSISPADDPSSFLFNETLNDYLANMAGLVPSMDTYVTQREAMFKNLDSYFSSGAINNDIAEQLLSKEEDFIYPSATY